MPRRSFARLSGAIMLLSGVLWAGIPRAQACMLDQKPSVLADGQLARLNPQIPRTAAEMATWTAFVLTRPYPAGHNITLVEDRVKLAHTLTAEALRQPCGWVFGDGQVAYGWTVRHTYARPGRWPIRVYVWDPESGRWDLFDQVTIRITR